MQKTKIEWTDYNRGYLAGITDGDGTFKMPVEAKTYQQSQWYWRVALKDRFILKRLRQAMRRLCIRLPLRPFSTPGMLKLETRERRLLNRIDGAIHYQPKTESFKLGYLAGIFDAEGNWHKSNLRIYNTKKDIRNKVIEYGRAFGFVFSDEQYPSEKWNGAVRLVGDRYDAIRFLASIRSAKSKKYLGVTGR